MKRPVGRPSSRQKILDAAEQLAREQGSANISLDAVAAKAGLSKGGLLYNFPTKAKLLEALVERHIKQAEEALAQSDFSGRAGPNAMAVAYVDYCSRKLDERPEPASGILAAIAENPELIDPVRRHRHQLVKALRENSADLEMSLIALLAVEGVWSMHMLETNCLTSAEIKAVLGRLVRELTPSKVGEDR